MVYVVSVKRVSSGFEVMFFDGRKVRVPYWFPLNERVIAFHLDYHQSLASWLRDILMFRKPKCYGTLLSLVYKRCSICPYSSGCNEALERGLNKYYIRLERWSVLD